MTHAKRLLAVLVAMTVADAAAGAQTFYGCGPFSCHTVVFTASAIAPTQAYGSTYSRFLNISWTHDFGATQSFFRYGSYSWPMPVGSNLDRLWDFVGWNSPNFCLFETFSSCNGTVTDGKSGLIHDNWSVSSTSVTVYRVDEAELLPGFDVVINPGPPHTVDLQLVPEPSTMLLSLAGLALTALGYRRRRMAT